MANVGSVGIKAEFIVDKAGLQRDVNSIFRNINMPNMRLDSRQFTEPLGRISRASTEFQRSLDASNARVIAFGASAGIIYSITASFKKLVEVTIEVEKSLADINVIFNLSKRQLVDFSDALFQVASQTGTSFNDVSKAALELSRQGLSVSETLKRTRDALALTRLSGIDATQSVESITAALNAFNNTLIDSTTLVSKLAAVDAKYAVSAGDLAEAFQRVGSTAVDAGVDIDSLVGLVTSAQQITARGGSVIGNALKTIFQRVQRPEVINSLQALNVQVRDLQGNTLSADKILQNLANTYKTLSSEQQNQVTQLAAGVFQANQFKAILNDLGKQNSIFSGATLISRGATDEAIQRIDELRKTTASYINETVNNLKNVGSQIGKIGIEPVIRQVLGVANFGADMIGSGPGKAIGESIMKGLAEFLSGPGLVSIGVLMLKLFAGVANFARQGFAQILESQSKSFRMQEQLGMLMGKYPEMQRQILQGNLSQEQVQQRIVQLLQQELATRSSISRVVQATTAGVANQSVMSIGGLKNIISSQNAAKPFLFKNDQLSLNPRRASVGLIPKVQEAVGALRGGYTPGAIRETVIPNFGKVVYNTAEKIKTFPGMKQPAIMPPSYSKAGQNYKKDFFGIHGFNPYAAGGIVPNFAGYIGPTKRLLQQLQKEGVNFNRWGMEAQFSPRMPPILPSEIQIPSPRNGGPKIDSPIYALFHEAGHYQNNALGIEKRIIDKLDFKGAAKNERFANTAARDLMQKFGMDEKIVKRFSPFAKKHYDTYRKPFGRPIKGITNIPFSLGDIENFTNKGLIPNFMPVISKQAAFEMLMNNRQKISALTYNSSSLGRPVEVNGLQWSSAVRHDLKTGTRPGNVERQKRGGFISLRGRFDGNDIEEIKNITLDKIKQIRSGGEIYDVANKGLIPNFSNILTRPIPTDHYGRGSRDSIYELMKEKTGSLVQFANGRDALDLRYINSAVRGEGREMFSKLFGLAQQYNKPITSELLRPQPERLKEIIPGMPNLEQLFKLYPQLKYRQGFGQTTGNMSNIQAGGKSNVFNSMRDINQLVKGVKNFNPLNYNFDNLTTYPSSGGLVPNFFEYPTLAQLRKGRPSLQGLLSHASGKRMLYPRYLDVDLNKVKGGINYKDKVDLSAMVENIQSKGNFVLNKGLIPNFSPLSNAVAREAKVRPLASIRIGANSSLKGALNPSGLGVYNTIDEPAGLRQGIQRTRNLGMNPKFAGASHGIIPNFAPYEYNTKAGVRPVNPYVQEQITNILTKYKAQIEKGTFLQGDFNKEIGDAIKQYRLTEKTSAQVNRQLEQSKKYYANKEQALFGPKISGYVSGFSQSQAVGQMNFDFNSPNNGPAQGEFASIMRGSISSPPLPPPIVPPRPPYNTMSPEEQERIRNQYISGQSLRRSFLSSSASIPGSYNERNSLQSPKLQESVRFGELKRIFTGGIKTMGAELFKRGLEPSGGTEESIKKLLLSTMPVKDRQMIDIIEQQKGQLLNEAKQKTLMGSYNRLNSGAGGLFNVMTGGYNKQGRSDINSLKQNNPELYNQLKQSAAGKAMGASFVLPFLGSALQQAMGTETKAARGFGQLGQGVANTASYAATGFGLGGPLGAAAGGVLGAITEAPRIYKAFTDNTPELEEEMQRLKEIIQKTSESFNGIIDVSDKLYRINTGQITNATRGQYSQLENERKRLLLSSPNPLIARKIIESINSGDVSGAQSLSQVNINRQANVLEQGKLGLVFKEALKNKNLRLELNSDNIGLFQKQLSENPRGLAASTGYGAAGAVAFNRMMAAKSIEVLQSPERQMEIEKLSGALQGAILTSYNAAGKQFIDVITGDKEGYQKSISGAIGPKGEIDAIKFIEGLKSFANKSGVPLNEETLKEAAKIDNGKLLKSFTTESIDKYIKSFESMGMAAIKSGLQFSKLNEILLQSQKEIIDLGSTFESQFIDKINELNLSFGRRNLSLGLSEQRNSFRENPYLNNFFNSERESLQIEQQKESSTAELKNSTRKDLLKIYSEGSLGKITNELEKLKEGGLFSGAENTFDTIARKNIENVQNTFKTSQGNFSVENLDEIIKNIENLDNLSRDLSKLSGLSTELNKLNENAVGGKIDLTTAGNSGNALGKFLLNSNKFKGAASGTLIQNNPQLEEKIISLLNPTNGTTINQKDIQKLIDDIRNSVLSNNDSNASIIQIKQLAENFKNQQKSIDVNYDTSRRINLEKYTGQKSFLTDEDKRQLGDSADINGIDTSFIQRSSARELGLSSKNFGLDISAITATPFGKIGIDFQKAKEQAEVEKNANLDSFSTEGFKSLIPRGINVTSPEELTQKINDFKKQLSDLNSANGVPFNEETLKKREETSNRLLGSIQQMQKLEADISIQKEKQNILYEEAISKSRQLTEQEKERLKIQLAFADDRAAALSNFNEQQARMGNFKDMNFKDSFLAEWEFGEKEFYKSLEENNKEFARDFKASVKGGFLEFANGTKDAKNALRDTGLAIATNLFNRTMNMGMDSMFGMIASGLGAGSSSFLQGLSTQKFSGGLIPYKYATGGLVSGGSGIRDDVPMALQPGSFVVRKNMASRYGGDALNAINSGAIPKFGFGGSMNPFNEKRQLKRGIKSANFKPSDYFQPKASTTSSGVDIALNNQYEYLGIEPTRPTSGRFDTSSMLSNFGRTDENSTQNQIKYAREAAQFSYSQSYQEYIKQQKAQMAQFEAGQNQRLYSSWINAAMIVGSSFMGGGARTSNPQSGPTAGSGSGTYDLGTSNIYTRGMSTPSTPRTSFGYYKGGMIPRHFSTGGFSGLDRTPALLTAGEYVINKNAVDYYGSNFLNKVNMGVVPPRELRGYQTGGVIGRGGLNSIGVTDSLLNYEQQMSEVISKLTSAIENLQKLFGNNNINNKQGKISTEPQSITINNNITINKATGEAKATTKATDGNSDQQDKDDSRKMGEAINAAVLKAIQQQLRQGGMIKESLGRK